MKLLQQIATKLNVNTADVTVAFSLSAFALFGFFYTQFFDERNPEKEKVDMLRLAVRYDSLLKATEIAQNKLKKDFPVSPIDTNSLATSALTKNENDNAVISDESQKNEHEVGKTLDNSSGQFAASSNYNPLKKYEVEKTENPHEEYKPKELPKEKININEATKDDLIKLPGVGEATAEKIIDSRKRKRFNAPEDVMEVTGIGEKKFEKMKKYIKVR